MALSKPDPQKYRGGSTSRLYKDDLAAWEASQQPPVAPAGQEDVVSLASTFDTEPDPFAPEPIEEYGAGSGYRGEPTTAPTTTTTNYGAGSGYRGEPTTPVVAPTTTTNYGAGSGYRGEPATPVVAPVAPAPPADYVPDYVEPEVTPEVETTTQAVDSWGRPDYSEYGERGRVVLSDSVTDFYTNMDTPYIPAMEGVNVVLGEGITEESLEQSRKKWAADFAAEQERIPQQREALANLFGEDQEKFKEVFEVLSVNNKLNFLNTLHTEGTFSKEDYLANAQQIMQQEQQRLYPDREEPLNYYFINSDYDTGDRLYEIPAAMADSENPLLHAKEVVLFDDQTIRNARSPLIEPEEYFRQSLGTTNNENADKRSTWVASRDEFLIPMGRLVLGIASGGMSEAAYTAARGLAGETLHGEDWATLGLAGLDMAGVTAPPTEVLDPTTGEIIVTAGKGIGGLSYEQTQGLVNAAATGDPTAFLVDEFGGDIINSTLDKIGINDDTVSPEVLAGIERTIAKLLVGEDFDSALESGVGEWARESNIGGELEDTLRTVGRDFDDKYLQPIKDALPEGTDFPDTPEGIKAIEDVARDIGSGIEDAVEPLKEPLQDVGRFIDDTLLQPAKDALLSGGDAMLTGMAGGGGGGQPSSTRTTDSLFRDELFKFSPVEFTNVERVVQPEQQQIVEEEEEMQDLFASPFTSPLDRYTV